MSGSETEAPAPLHPCENCGKRPTPPKSKSGGKPSKLCFACQSARGTNFHRTLRRIAKQEGIEAAARAARDGGVALPADLAKKDRAVRTKQVGTEDALSVQLLATALGVDSNIEKAGAMVGLSPEDALRLEPEARKLEKLTHGDPTELARLLSQGSLVGTLQAIQAGATGRADEMARYAHSAQRMSQSIEALTGGARLTPPKITVVFRLADGSQIP